MDTMADSESSARSKTADLVVEALDCLVHRYHFSLNQIFGEQLKTLTIDDMEKKAGLLEELESSLLPSMKDQITALLLSLDLRGWGKPPRPDLELALGIVSNLDQTLYETIASIECISLESPLPAETHDHHLRSCKEFRCSRLLWRIKAVVEGHLCELFRNYIDFIRLWELSTSSSHPDSSEHHTKTSQKEAEILKITAHSGHLIDAIISLFRKSDLDFIQEEWLAAADSLNGVLGFLIILANCPKEPNGINAGRDDHRTNGNRAEIAEVARLAIPLVKLTRAFLDKIGNKTTRKAAFTLDSELNSETLNQLHQEPVSIAERLDQFVRSLWMIHKRDEVIINKDRIRTSLSGISKTLESTLLVLAVYLVPLPHHENELPSPDPQFKTWLLTLKTLWYRAMDHFLDGLYCVGGGEYEQPLLQDQPRRSWEAM
ncbi:hypothetical protein PGT21_036612 [Puccinia graminis f. sp. tritici]|uniref:Uncharacterized protein n=1 Tax=Puccinia graminis f. sp. tritici TaxID=56615 RepID=A0A5B0PDZ2_PUCGR|nr:hypothetical protein PGT21_036612 [Puccinia graminis f. sp. tritici]KAA1100422.1 hypothetical protein PGTUg99_027403 [Puccinia graminis f. sp. tritici]